MRFAEYFLQHGSPVLYDPFAIQTQEKILATYPDLFPGLLCLLVFQACSYVGMHVLRILVYLSPLESFQILMDVHPSKSPLGGFQSAADL